MTGVGTQSLELSGNLRSISNALSIIGLEGSSAGVSVVTVQGRDTLGLTTNLSSFEIDYSIGAPSILPLGWSVY